MESIMLDAPISSRDPQPPPEWLERFAKRLARLHPAADPEPNFDLASKLWAADDIAPEAAAEIVARLLPDGEPAAD
jgi:hypothetical protein